MSIVFAFKNISEVFLLVRSVGLSSKIIAHKDKTCPKIITSFKLSNVPVSIDTEPAYAYPKDMPRGRDAFSETNRLPSLTVYVVSDQTANITVKAISKPSSINVETSEGSIQVRL